MVMMMINREKASDYVINLIEACHCVCCLVVKKRVIFKKPLEIHDNIKQAFIGECVIFLY